MTSQPTEPPKDGPAVELPPHGEHWRPEVTVYSYPHPLLWIFWPDRWALATVRAKHEYASGLVAYQVELSAISDGGTMSRVTRTFAWNPDSIRPA